MNKKLYLILITTFVGVSLQAQVLRNDGKMNVAGGYLVINGSYQNESVGGINLNGIITVSGNWTNNGSGNGIDNPDTNGEVVFNGTSQSIGGSAGVCDFEKITINSSSTTQVIAGKGVTAYGACMFNTPLVLKSSTTPYRPIMATFINNNTVTGNISMELSYTSTGSSAAGTGRGMYFSSPISNATSTIFNVAAGSNLLWYQNEVTRQYIKVTANGIPLTNAKGYILRAPTSNVFTFTGTPNTALSYSNNNIPRAVTGQYYLFGNPYPAVIDWQTIATKTNLSNTIWYQTSSTAGTPMVVDTWNGDSQTGTNNNGTAPVDGKIPPMQSFWVQCANVLDIGTLTVEGNDRTHNWGTSNFLKSRAFSTDKNLIRLYLYSDNKRDEAIIIQSESAQDEIDSWDSRKMLLKDASRAEFYTISPEKTNLVIQSVKPITESKAIRIGFTIGTAGEYKFVANLIEASNSNNVFLEDKLLNISQDLMKNPDYIFNSSIIDDTSRFVLHIFQAPKVITNNQLSACYPGTVDLTNPDITKGSTPNLEYTYWTDASATIAYLTPKTASEGTYYIKGTSQNGAYTLAGPINVLITPLPTIITSNPAEVIEPATVDLTAPEITLGSTEGLIYSYWTDIDATIPFITPKTATSGDYFIKGTFESTGCYSIAGPVKVIINANTTDIAHDVLDNALIYSYHDEIHLLNFDLNSTIAIFDILGKQEYYQILKSNHEILTLKFRSGIYIVKVAGSKGVKSKKIYIQ